MALSIKNEEADRLARELSRLTGESMTEAIVVALRERVERQRRQPGLEVRLRRVIEEAASLDVLDPRSPEEIIGFDQQGLPR